MRFRKKPVVIEAIKFDGSYGQALDFTGGFPAMVSYPNGNGGESIAINTLEGQLTVHAGDWLIKGVKGEFYPCRADIFEMTYEPEENPPSEGSK